MCIYIYIHILSCLSLLEGATIYTHTHIYIYTHDTYHQYLPEKNGEFHPAAACLVRISQVLAARGSRLPGQPLHQRLSRGQIWNLRAVSGRYGMAGMVMWQDDADGFGWDVIYRYL